MMMVAMGFKMPVTRLFGRAPAGMNATGESDTRFFAMLQTECQMRGVYFHNFNFERFFACTAHTQREVDHSLEVIATSTKIVKQTLSTLPAGI